MDLVDSIRERLVKRQQKNKAKITLILEPGRSIIANAGVFIAPVTGVK
jgi:diaminopimelate decarboxylase